MSLFLRKNRKYVILFLLIFLQLMLISLQVRVGGEDILLEKAFFSIFSPFAHGIHSLFQKTNEAWTQYFFLRKVVNQNERLRRENDELRQENELLRRSLEAFRLRLKIQENLSPLYHTFLLATVIGSDTSNIYRSVIINKGSLDGIKKDMAVLDRYGNLVGRVAGPISLKEARVQLITDEDCGVSVFSQNRKTVGVLTGNSKGLCFMKYVLASDQNLADGDELLTSGFDNIFPSRIPVGKVISISVDSTLFKNIAVKPFFELGNLDQVALLPLGARKF